MCIRDRENPLRHLTEVESLINATFIEIEGESLRFRDFIGEKLPQDTEQSLRLLEQGLAEPDYPRVLISQNNEYGMLFLRTKLNAVPLDTETEAEDSLLEGFEETAAERGANDPQRFVEHGLEEYADFEKAAWELLRQERFHKDLEFQHPAWGAFYQNDVWAVDYQWALAAAVLLSLAMTSILLGSLRAVIWPMLIILSSMLGVLGLAGWTGWPIDLTLYIAFGPYKNPRYAVSIIVEHGGSGSKTAAPIAKKLFKLIIDRHELREKITKQDLINT